MHLKSIQKVFRKYFKRISKVFKKYSKSNQNIFKFIQNIFKKYPTNIQKDQKAKNPNIFEQISRQNLRKYLKIIKTYI